MTAFRLGRWIILIVALLASVGWAYVSIDHLLNDSMSEQERVAEYSATPQPPSVHRQQIDLEQKHWGRQSMFALAVSVAFLLAVMMNWVLDGRPRRSGTSGGDLK
jgi:NADH:ubiquinone oxidoreductase subunit 3 (subunit A)